MLMDVPEKKLPGDFADRLVASVRRRRRVRRMRTAAAIVVAALVCGGAAGLFSGKPATGQTRVAIVAARDGASGEKEASGWVLLGFIRECFRRNKANRRKEEE